MTARQRIAVEAAVGRSGNVDIAVRVGRNGVGEGVRPSAHLPGVDPGPGSVVLGEEEVGGIGARQRIAIETAIGRSGNVDIAVRIGRGSVGLGVRPGAHLPGVDLGPARVVLGEEEIDGVGARQCVAVEVTVGGSGDVDITVHVGRGGAGQGSRISARAHLLGPGRGWRWVVSTATTSAARRNHERDHYK